MRQGSGPKFKGKKRLVGPGDILTSTGSFGGAAGEEGNKGC